MPQYSFTTSFEFMFQIEALADKENRSRSEMIELLLRKAINERNRKRKKDTAQHNTADPR